MQRPLLPRRSATLPRHDVLGWAHPRVPRCGLIRRDAGRVADISGHSGRTHSVSVVSIGASTDHAATAAAPCARLQDRRTRNHRVKRLSVQLRAARLSFWCPTPHSYVFELFALDCQLDLSDSVTLDDALHAMAGHDIARGRLDGTYEVR